MVERDSSNWMWAEACARIERTERLQRDFFRPSANGAQHVGWEPPVDICETEDQFWVHAALPGVEQSTLEVAIETDVLIISGSRPLSVAPNATPPP